MSAVNPEEFDLASLGETVTVEAAPLPPGGLAEQVAATVSWLRLVGPAPRTAVLLGSGWNHTLQALTDTVEVPYAELPAFPEVQVGGHGRHLVLGQLDGRPVAVLSGRRHTYEGGRVEAMLGAIRSLAAWGVTHLVQTGAAGSLRSEMRPGELMLVQDHLNLAQRSPLWWEEDDRRFVDMSNAYDEDLRLQAQVAAAGRGVMLHEGVYAWTVGPQYETPAEIRMLRHWGADAVGMSAVPETIAARHAGLQVLTCVLITNMAAGLGDGSLTHDHTLERARLAEPATLSTLSALVEATY